MLQSRASCGGLDGKNAGAEGSPMHCKSDDSPFQKIFSQHCLCEHFTHAIQMRIERISAN
jgi:hypothetical protein